MNDIFGKYFSLNIQRYEARYDGFTNGVTIAIALHMIGPYGAVLSL